MTAKTGTTSVLIVDDEQNIRHMLMELLSRNGFKCTDAPDGMAALTLLKKKAFDLGVFDIVMPGMSGWELASKAREISPDMHLIAISAVACAPDLTDFGFEAVLRKPFSCESFLRVCKSFVGIGGAND